MSGRPHQHADAVVVRQRVAPEGVEAPPVGLPVGLMDVEVGGADLAHLVRDGLPPREAPPLRVVVEHVDQQRQARQRVREGANGRWPPGRRPAAAGHCARAWSRSAAAMRPDAHAGCRRPMAAEDA